MVLAGYQPLLTAMSNAVSFKDSALLWLLSELLGSFLSSMGCALLLALFSSNELSTSPEQSAMETIFLRHFWYLEPPENFCTLVLINNLSDY